MVIVYIHGHGASADSFNFIRSQLKAKKELCLAYDSHKGFDPNLADMLFTLRDEQKIFFVVHSLGGVYARHLADKLGSRVLGAVSMGTPYGGSESAWLLNLFHPQQLYRDIHPSASPITQGLKIDLCKSCNRKSDDCSSTCNWVAIVTTKGHSQLMLAANDGVVTQSSMRNVRGVRFVEIDSNHHEIVQSMKSVDVIRETIRSIKPYNVTVRVADIDTMMY